MILSAIALASVMQLSPCQYEDSANCVWDASRMGNGKGKSFVNVQGEYYYIATPPKDVRKVPVKAKITGPDKVNVYQGDVALRLERSSTLTYTLKRR